MRLTARVPQSLRQYAIETSAMVLSKMRAPQLTCRKAILLIIVSAIVAVALINRMYFLLYRGGFALDQQAWAQNNYYGGLSTGYFMMADAIRKWTAEESPWAYLPGYPAFLATLHLLGIEDASFVRFVQIVIDSLVILPLYYVLLRVGKSACLSIIGCLIYAAAPWWSVGSTYLLAESLLPALVILLLAAMVIVRDRSTAGINWFVLGLFSAILPFFRSEMVLLVGPLIAWALLVSPKRKRISSIVFVIAGFALPLVLWAIRNYYIHGQFMLTPPVKWYAAWSGLGQIQNHFGYVTNDARAIELLKSLGIRYHSAAAENYWFDQYLNAWMIHPGHVIRTILRRFEMILGEPETLGTFTSRLVLFCYGAMAFITPVALVRLLRARRAADAFLIAWPMLYALATLGVLYVERRYVRYAGLTYLLVLPVAYKMIMEMRLPLWMLQWQYPSTRLLKLAVGTVIMTILVSGVGLQILSMRAVAGTQALANRLDARISVPPTSTLGEIRFKPVIPTVSVSHNPAELELRASAPAGTYLLMTPMGSQLNGAVIVHYRVTLKRGRAVGIGILSADTTTWLSHQTAIGAAGETLEGTLISQVEVGSSLIIDAQDGSGETAAAFDQLDWAFVCPESANLFRVFLGKEKIHAGTCSVSPSRPAE